MNIELDSLIKMIILPLVLSWISPFMLKKVLKQTNKINNFIYTKMSFRTYNYGINNNILFVGIIMVSGILIPKQVQLEREIQGYEKDLSIYKEEYKPQPEFFTKAGKINNFEKEIILLNNINSIFQLTISFIILFFGVRIAFSEIINKEVSEFERDLKILKPIINKEEFEQLESLWGQMRSIEDFKNIRKEIKALKENVSS
ncbi:hypothetical protein [Capnocytophaga gingivalis]